MNVIGIINYGAGNLASVMKSVEYAGGQPTLVSTPEAIAACERIILPGVGAAGEALQRLRSAHFIEALDEKVRQQGAPFLGICLGMQLLGDCLYEFGEHQGLGWIAGSVVPLKTVIEKPVRIPHMGWNDVDFKENASAFSKKLGRYRQFYFSHSFTFRVKHPDNIAASVDHGGESVAAVCQNNIFATQFHPEKSQLAGDYLMQAFLEWCP